MLWSCLMKCWSDKVYLSPLAHRFWKLTLQLYSRYAKFLDEVNLNNNSKTITLNAVPTKQYANDKSRCSCSIILSVSVQVLTKLPHPEVTKEPTRPLPSSASSTSSRTSVDDGGSESGSPVSLSTKQLVYIAADIQKLQEQVHTCKLKTHI